MQALSVAAVVAAAGLTAGPAYADNESASLAGNKKKRALFTYHFGFGGKRCVVSVWIADKKGMQVVQ